MPDTRSPFEEPARAFGVRSALLAMVVGAVLVSPVLILALRIDGENRATGRTPSAWPVERVAEARSEGAKIVESLVNFCLLHDRYPTAIEELAIASLRHERWVYERTPNGTGFVLSLSMGERILIYSRATDTWSEHAEPQSNQRWLPD